MPSAERIQRRELKRPTRELSGVLHDLIEDVRIIVDPGKKETIDDKNKFLEGMAKKAMLVINARWWQRGRIKRQRARETEKEPNVRAEVDRILAIGIDVRAEAEAKKGIEIGKYFADRWKDRIRKAYAISYDPSPKATAKPQPSAESDLHVVYGADTSEPTTKKPAQTMPAETQVAEVKAA